ncbi:hypothetical protein K2173_010642 [Erythroxylum novogranatense]|uniref:Bromo domain-containing protein n=1 Tax=Erythroxylum novogranatense TaxID=1862640 RepID=A0AAV8TFG7_9ROSI|nr:hypothetical protein K2173_010642 [Erythroxylum novogranatense]
MGKIVERRKKKKKGRPSLLDLQKRTLKEQQQYQQTQHLKQKNRNFPNSTPHIYNSATPTPIRRSTRRNPTPSSPDSLSHHNDDDDDAELRGKRREKKLKLVLKLPSSQKSDPNSSSFNSNGSDSSDEDDKNVASNHKKRKINAIGDGSGFPATDKGEKSVSATNPTNDVQDSGPSTPLPDKKLLLFILDRLQKKDTYGVFSEPVDPEELPDYHEVIENPMDFGTVRKKLSGGVYASLEQFEKDVFLICSNAMQYNAPDTIYFRQARSIQELATKNFENLRQDSDDNEAEPKVVRRGRPPTKNLKKPLGRPPLDRAGSEFSSDATLATGGDSGICSINDLRKGPQLSDKSGLTDSLVQFTGSRVDDNKSERHDEATGSKGSSLKFGKKQFPLDDNRRNTYNNPLAGGREPSVLSTFDAERKQLMAVGLLSEHGYARSLARFAANIGPVAWRIASKRIETSLPPGVKYGPGWVGENDIPPQRPLLPSSSHPGQSSFLQPFSCLEDTLQTAELREENISGKPREENFSDKMLPSMHSHLEGHINNSCPPSASNSSLGSTTAEPFKEREATERTNLNTGLNMLNSSVGEIRSRPPIQIHQSSVIHPGMNGYNGTYRLDLPAQMGKQVGSAAISPGFNYQSSPFIGTVSATNSNFVHPAATANSSNLEIAKLSENLGAVASENVLGKSATNDTPKSRTQSRSSWKGITSQSKPESGLSPQQKSDTLPPDLNVRFQSPGSPNSNSRVDSAQPDLALQL